MKKFLSMTLAAVMTLGTAMTAMAAPLAKKAQSPRAQVRAEMSASDAGALSRKASPRRGKATLTCIPTKAAAKAAHIDGLHRVESKVAAQRKRAARSASASQRSIAANQNLYGGLIYSDLWAEDNSLIAYGIYKLPYTAGDDFELVFETEGMNYVFQKPNGDYVIYGEESFWGYFLGAYVSVYSPEGDLISSQALDDQRFNTTDIAVDPTTGDVYGLFPDYANAGEESVPRMWAKADFDNLTVTRVADLQLGYYALACTDDGQMYGVGVEGQDDWFLYKIDKTNGTHVVVGPTDAATDYLTGACYNPANNTMVMATSTDYDGSLVEIDLATGEATTLVVFANAEGVVSPFFARPSAEDKAPAQPELAVTCADGGMEVAITLTMPTTLFDGTPASQEMSYTVLAGDVEVAAGAAMPGAVVNATATLTASGMTTFMAFATNDTGDSPKARVNVYVGKGAPDAPKNVVLTWDAGVATLTWDAVTTSSDKGYINPADVTYNVYSADGDEVATGLTATTFTQTVSADGSSDKLLSYAVTAVYDTKESAPTASNVVMMGSLTAPCTVDMRDESVFNLHTVVDLNNDDRTWYFSDNAKYKYSTENTADDWLISPAIDLEGGKIYTFSALMRNHGTSYPERVEIFYGTAPTADAMTNCIVEPTLLKDNQMTTLDGMVVAAASGKYYIGFHAISDADMYYINLFEYSLSAAADNTIPAAVENLKVVPDADGLMAASVQFTAPSVDMGGNPLTGQLTIHIERDGEAIANNIRLAPGAAFAGDDETLEGLDPGTYKYTVYASNADGNGPKVSASAFIGPATPATPEGFKIEEVGEGKFNISWQAVTADQNGNAINPANVKYEVFQLVPQGTGLGYGPLLTPEPIAATTFEANVAVPADYQDFMYFAVRAVNLSATGQPAFGALLVGPAYDLPVTYTCVEDFDNFFMETRGDSQVSVAHDNTYTGLTSAEGDDCYFILTHEFLGDNGSMVTGKIQIPSAATPAIQMMIFRFDGMSDEGYEPDTSKTEIYVEADGQSTLVATIDNSDLAEGQWNKVNVPLTGFAGKVIRVEIRGVCTLYANQLYDGIKIYNMVDNDLSVAIAGPAQVKTGQEFDVNVTVTNEGTKAATAFTVELLRDGAVVGTKAVSEALASGEKIAYAFPQTLTLMNSEPVRFQAVVTMESDENVDNNESKVLTVARAISKLPVPTGLSGERKPEGNLISWDAYVPGVATVTTVTNDIEDAESWAHEYDDWTFIDVDKLVVGGFQNINLPGIEPGATKASFFVFDSSIMEGNPTFEAHSGDKYLATLFQYEDQPIDDWACSPLLSGAAQTVTFYAKSYSSEYPEKIEVYATDGDADDLQGYTKVMAAKTLSSEWTLISASLPAGSTHFAIRSCAAGSFMLMVDDIKYEKSDAFNGTHLGYNIYRSGQKLNAEPLSAAGYLDATAEGDALYHVSNLFAEGESELSDECLLNDDALEMVVAGSLVIRADHRVITVSGARDRRVTIATADGRTLATATGDTRQAVAPGIYLVTVGRATAKLLVR